MTSESATTNQKRPNSYADLLLTVAIAFTTVGVNFALSISWYQFGLNPRATNLILGNLIPCTMAYLVLIFFLFLALIVRVCVQGRKLGIKRLCLRISLIVISILVVVASHKLAKPGFYYLTQGFHKRMQNEADISAIRAWLKTADRNSQDMYYEIDKSEWPDAVKKLSPQYMFIEMSDNDETQVRIEWGGAFGHWGMVVGPPTMEIPASDLRRSGEYRVKLTQGAYVWHEIQ